MDNFEADVTMIPEQYTLFCRTPEDISVVSNFVIHYRSLEDVPQADIPMISEHDILFYSPSEKYDKKEETRTLYINVLPTKEEL